MGNTPTLINLNLFIAHRLLVLAIVVIQADVKFRVTVIANFSVKITLSWIDGKCFHTDKFEILVQE